MRSPYSPLRARAGKPWRSPGGSPRLPKQERHSIGARSCSGSPKTIGHTWRKRSIARESGPGSRAASGAPTRRAGPFWPFSVAGSRTTRRFASRSTSRSARFRTRELTQVLARSGCRGAGSGCSSTRPWSAVAGSLGAATRRSRRGTQHSSAPRWRRRTPKTRASRGSTGRSPISPLSGSMRCRCCRICPGCRRRPVGRAGWARSPPLPPARFGGPAACSPRCRTSRRWGLWVR